MKKTIAALLAITITGTSLFAYTAPASQGFGICSTIIAARPPMQYCTTPEICTGSSAIWNTPAPAVIATTSTQAIWGTSVPRIETTSLVFNARPAYPSVVASMQRFGNCNSPAIERPYTSCEWYTTSNPRITQEAYPIFVG